MVDRDEQPDVPVQRPAEGVRIIGAQEAQAALDAGQAAGRRPDDELRFGDVPPPPAGPRLPHRFPLPDSVDPAVAVPRPSVLAPVEAEETTGGIRRVVPVAAGPDPSDARSGIGGASAWSEATQVQPKVTWADLEAAAPSPGHLQPAHVATAGTRADLAVGDGTAAADGGPSEGSIGFDEHLSAGDTEVQPAASFSADSARHDQSGPFGEASVGTASPTEWPPSPQDLDDSYRDSNRDPDQDFHGEGLQSPVMQPWAAPLADQPGTAAGATAAGATAADALVESEPASAPIPDLAPPEEGITLHGASEPGQWPHWTDPPTGEVPHMLVGSDPEDVADMSAWGALGARGLRWRDGADDWNDADEMGALADDRSPLGALDQSRSEHSDLYSFDEEFDRLEEERSGVHPVYVVEQASEEGSDPVAISTGTKARAAGRIPRVGRGDQRAGRPQKVSPAPNSGGGGRDLRSAVGVGVALVLLLIICYAIGARALLALSAIVLTAAAAELYGHFRRAGLHAAQMLGLTAVVGVLLAAYWRGEPALPLLTVIVTVGSLLWFAWGVEEGRAVRDSGVTLLGFAWVGLLGSYAALLLRANHGKHLFIAAVVPTVAADIVAYLVGSRFGSRLMAPMLSPGKTWEGTLAGGVAAIVVSFVFVGRLAPFSHAHALELGVVIALVAPLGDLCESLVKRDLHLKDSGTSLPGHGGLLDRFDSLLFVLPATYYVVGLLSLYGK